MPHLSHEELRSAAEMVAGWIAGAPDAPREQRASRLKRLRTAVLRDDPVRLGKLLVDASFTAAAGGQPIPPASVWSALLSGRPRSWEGRLLLAGYVIAVVQERKLLDTAPVRLVPDSEAM
ncbi:hypothetical protein ABZ569_33975 [Streptomyces albus]|uniref:hypothetical protein n=1 Tax=Streptomyces albus TaxID=1888 RepID=UPI0033CDF946